jgi:hypothetical protein
VNNVFGDGIVVGEKDKLRRVVAEGSAVGGARAVGGLAGGRAAIIPECKVVGCAEERGAGVRKRIIRLQ